MVVLRAAADSPFSSRPACFALARYSGSCGKNATQKIALNFYGRSQSDDGTAVGASYFAKEHGLPRRGSDQVLAELREGEE
jgi:hypothetical protein